MAWHFNSLIKITFRKVEKQWHFDISAIVKLVTPCTVSLAHLAVDGGELARRILHTCVRSIHP